MVDIQINNGFLDIYDSQDIEMQWTGWRFSDGIAAPFTTDITVPKTHNNLQLIGYDSLLDSPNQLFGSELKPATIYVNGQMVRCYLQLVSVRDDELDICVYEDVFPQDMRDKNLARMCVDDESTIHVWVMNSAIDYPEWFVRYNYGSPYQGNLAQFHPSKRLNDVMSEIGYGQLQVDNDFYLMASSKYVCPQNPKQVISCHLGTTPTLVMVGGQHVVNDIEGYDGKSQVGDSTVTKIVYNRECQAVANIWVSWGRKFSTTSGNYYIRVMQNNAIIANIPISITQRSGMAIRSNVNISIAEGDEISFKLWDAYTNNPQDDFELISILAEFDYSDYVITDDDYGIDLVYCSKHPALVRWDPPQVNQTYHYADGSTHLWYEYKQNGGTYRVYPFTLPYLGYSYIGYWCNIPDVKFSDFLFSLAWLTGMEITFYDNQPVFAVNNSSKVITANITEVRPSSERIGRSNYIQFTGEDNASPVMSVDNIWLEEDKTLHESVFAYVQPTKSYGKINQYEITTDEDGTSSVSYNEVDGIVLMRYSDRIGRYPYAVGLIPPGDIHTFDFQQITSTVEVTMETYDDEVKGKDYLYVDGRKYMVIEGSSDMKEGLTTITALLVPTT